MAKKNSPIITHVEILCNAIRNIEREIRDQKAFMDGIPQCEAMLASYIAERTPKLEALKEMYRIETGTDYD